MRPVTWAKEHTKELIAILTTFFCMRFRSPIMKERTNNPRQKTAPGKVQDTPEVKD